MSKFSSVLAEELYAQSLDGFSDNEFGSTSEAPFRHWVLLDSTILTEDSQGFVDAEEFSDVQHARLRFDTIVAEAIAEMSPTCDGCNWVNDDCQGDGETCFNCGRAL